jgi:prepilin-type N-terminal cleavage/methylation domain-containing protein
MNKGYTFLEILIVTAIVSIVTSGIFMSLSSSRQAWDALQVRTALQLELRKAISRISDDLKQASMDQIFSNSGMTTALSPGGVYSEIYFYLPQGVNPTGTINWDTVDPVIYTLDNGTITRTRGATSVDICSSIVGLNFTVLPNDVIRIDVSGQKVKAVEHGNATVQASLESAVALRN